MKKFIIKSLLAGLNLFENLVVNKFPSEWVKRITKLGVARFRLFGQALIDNDPNDKAQLEKIARETLASPEFADLEGFITTEIANKIPNDKLAKILLMTENLRLNFFVILGDDNPDNKKQIEDLFESYLHSEDFDTVAITLTELLAEKYAKNPQVKEFLIQLVTELVNSDDNN